MAEDELVATLRLKRAELASRRELLVSELTVLEADLGHVDGVLRLFAPSAELLKGGRKPPARPFLLPGVRPGETARVALEVLRAASAPRTWLARCVPDRPLRPMPGRWRA